jgi:hypothetical protein
MLQLGSALEDLAVRRAVEAAVDISAGEPGLPLLSAVEEVYFAAWKLTTSPRMQVLCNPSCKEAFIVFIVD